MSKWVTSWGIPTSFVNEGIGNIIENTSFRHVFYNPIAGTKIRVRFTNEYGDSDAKIDSASIAEWSGDAAVIMPETLAELTFNKEGNVIKAGKELLCDEIEYTLEPKKYYVLTYYFKDITYLATGYNKYADDPFFPCWLGRGDFTKSEDFPLEKRRQITNYVFLSGVDVLTTDETNAVMAFGDSITARPWPDFFVRRINDEGYTNRSVVRRAIGGNRILKDYEEYLPRRGFGTAAIRRFETAIKQTAGVDKVIMLQGINDIYHPQIDNIFCGLDQMPTAEEMIEGYKFCCDIAHKYGAKYYLATILPTNHMIRIGDGRENIRLAVNEWIRTNDYIDGFIEFEKAVMDKENPHIMAKEYDCGDTLHPNADGSKALCDAVPDHIYKD